MTAEPLERAYRRLLLAYPRPYRRRHGTEILTTLLEMAGPEQDRPARRDAWHLLASGIRQRFRVPGRRVLGVTGAVLATLVLAMFGAAAGSWLGWKTGPALPDDATMGALAQTVGTAGSAEHVLYGASATIRDSTGMFGGSLAEVMLWRFIPVAQTGTAPVPLAAALADQGWRPGPRSPWASTTFVRDGVWMSVREAGPEPGDPMSIGFTIAEPTVVLPLVIAGTLLGGMLGWLLAAALSQRARGRRAPGLMWLAALAVLTVPALAILGSASRLVVDPLTRGRPTFAIHNALSPSHYIIGPGRLMLLLSLLGAVFALAAALLTHRPTAHPDPQTTVQLNS